MVRFGRPLPQGYEMPYNVAQFVFIYNRAKAGSGGGGRTPAHPAPSLLSCWGQRAESISATHPAPSRSRTRLGRGRSRTSSRGSRPTRAASPCPSPPTATSRRLRLSGTSSTSTAAALPLSRCAGADRACRRPGITAAAACSDIGAFHNLV